MSVAALSDELLAGEEVAHVTSEPAREATTAPLPPELDERVAAALERQGITALFEHQAEAWAAAARGEHVAITTGTASGKTLAFNLPVLDAIARDPKTRALYLYPTKALAQDQARSLTALGVPGVRPAIYDGDTPVDQRRQVRTWANAILSNPDMLHLGVLPHHDRWGDVLANLEYVIVDEAHVYRGVFGSHVGNVLRRLRRLAAVYGAEPQFLLASATIANPAELASSLTGLEATVVSGDSAPRAERTIVLWNPPVTDEELNLRASALGEGSRLLAELVERGLRTLCFAKSRKAAELIHRFALDRLGREYAERLSPYRAGYTPAQRRDIEQRLATGELLGVSATDALELGIDIGLLDCVISVGFPGTVASLRQQWGRAGRQGHGLAVLVASDDALDQYFMREPDALLGRRVEAAILDHANPRVLDGHVLAAAYEAPIDDADRATLGDEALERAAQLPELRLAAAGFTWTGRDYPAARISLRSAGVDSVLVVEADSGSVLGIVERERAYSTVHEGAIYLHLGEAYLVSELDLAAGAALVEPVLGRLVHAGEEGHDHGHRGSAARSRSRGRGAVVRPRLRHRARRRLPAEVDARRRGAGDGRARPSSGDVRDGGRVVRAVAIGAGRLGGDAEAARLAARRRARDDRAAAAVRDVRPLGHRRPVDERPLPDGRADGVRLRRPPRWSGHRGARLRGVRRVGCGHGSLARRVPVRERVPVVRAVAEVRESQRDAGQRRRAPVAAPDARRMIPVLTPHL